VNRTLSSNQSYTTETRELYVVPTSHVALTPGSYQDPARLPFAVSPGALKLCCSVRNLSPEARMLAMKSGLAVHELSDEELALIFPKLRTVTDSGDSKATRTEVIGNGNSFEKEIPAHLQLSDQTLAGNLPTSLLEYEYATGQHMSVVYRAFGKGARDVLSVEVYQEPPLRYDPGTHSFTRALVQVEVSSSLLETARFEHCLTRPFCLFLLRLQPFHKRIAGFEEENGGEMIKFRFLTHQAPT
jgi:hypothetical protein